jgi:hypothetical protein
MFRQSIRLGHPTPLIGRFTWKTIAPSSKASSFKLSALTLVDLRRLEPALLGAEQKVAHGFSSMLALVPVIHASISKLHSEVALEGLRRSWTSCSSRTREESLSHSLYPYA